MCEILNNVKSAYVIPEEFYYYYNNRPGNVISAKIDGRSLELIEGAKRIYDILKEKGNTTSGFRRICIATNEVMSKIPMTFEGIQKNAVYLRAISELLKYPVFRERLAYYFNSDFGKRERLKYFCMQFEPLYMYFKLLKRKLIS